MTKPNTRSIRRPKPGNMKAAKAPPSSPRKPRVDAEASKKPVIPGGEVTESAARVSAVFREAASLAEDYARNPARLRKLFAEATKKSQGIPRAPFAETWAYFMAMLRLIRAYYSGSYREMPRQSLLLIIVAVIYFVSAVDAIPDWIPGAGLLDDALVVGLTLKSVKDDLDAFMEWETAVP